jgi:hypothetical protein
MALAIRCGLLPAAGQSGEVAAAACFGIRHGPAVTNVGLRRSSDLEQEPVTLGIHKLDGIVRLLQLAVKFQFQNAEFAAKPN